MVDTITGKVCYSKDDIEPNKEFSPVNLRAFVSYKIVLSEKGNGMFAKEKTILEIPYFFANAKELVNHIFEVHVVEIFNGSEIIRKHISGNGTTLKFLGINRDDNQTYVGKLRRIGEFGDELHGLGLLKVSTEAEFENDKLWVYISDIRGEDQLLFDVENRKIYRTNDIERDPRAKKMPGIERYLIKHI